jgi:CheY-like chemotaxis protein
MRKIRTLLVDDNLIFLKMASAYMSEMEMAEVVGVASNGLEAIVMTDTLKPDLVVMDLRMPEMGGLEATPRIKSGSHPPIVVIVTFNDLAGYRMPAREAGVDVLISKTEYANELQPIIARLSRSGAGTSKMCHP